MVQQIFKTEPCAISGSFQDALYLHSGIIKSFSKTYFLLIPVSNF